MEDNYKQIVLATDLSEDCYFVARKARVIAEKHGANLSMIHVVEPIPAYGYPGVSDVQSPFIEHAREEMEKMATEIGVSADNQYVEVGSTKGRILELCKEIKADLIIVGSHGRHGITRLLGSTTSAIIHGAHCDVLTVRMQEN